MFLLDSIIIHMIWKCIKKYVKKLDPNDAELSIWAGDVVFRNVDLNLDLFEAEFPEFAFSFLTAHIQELHIHVPWTKLATEPIDVTINSFELSFKLRDCRTAQKKESEPGSGNKPQTSIPEEVLSSYTESLMNRVLWNFNFVLNNVILKYIEEDMVFAINVKSVGIDTASREWKKAYIDPQKAGLILRKLITLNDLSVYMDETNANGEIEIPQAPVIQRCAIQCRSYIAFDSLTTNLPHVLRLDLFCDKMEISVADQQLPLCMRILQLIGAFYFGDLEWLPSSVMADEEKDAEKSLLEGLEEGKTWEASAWSLVPLLNTISDDDDSKNGDLPNPNPVFHFGFYVHKILLLYQTTETKSKSLEEVFHCNLEELNWDSYMRYPDLVSFQIGFGAVEVVNVGDELNGRILFRAGQFGSNQMKYSDLSIFNENQTEKCDYNCSWEEHFQKITEAKMLEIGPFLSIDYFYHFVQDNAEFNQTYTEMEESNLKERLMLRLIFGPCELNITGKSMYHIVNFLRSAFRRQFRPYSSYQDIIREIKHRPIPTAEDVQEMEEFIPFKSYSLAFIQPTVRIFPTEHSCCDVVKTASCKKNQKRSNLEGSIQPVIMFDVQRAEIQQTIPMYPTRVVEVAINMGATSEYFLHHSQSHLTGKLSGVEMSLANTHHGHVDDKFNLIPPFSISVYLKELQCPDMWNDPLQAKTELLIEMDRFSVYMTCPQLLLVFCILNSWHQPSIEKTTFVLTDLPEKAVLLSNEFSTIEMFLNNFECKCSKNDDVYSVIARINNCCVTLQHLMNNESQHVTVLHGPESKKDIHSANFLNESSTVEDCFETSNDCLKIVIQFSDKLEPCSVPTLFIVSMEGFSIYLDPVLYNWLDYCPKNFTDKPIAHAKSSATDYFSSKTDTANSSLKFNEAKYVTPKFYDRLFSILKRLVIEVKSEAITLFLPTTTTMYGSNFLHVAYRMQKMHELGITENTLVVNLPKIILYSGPQMLNLASKIDDIPVYNLEEKNIVGQDLFPCSLTVENFSIYTIFDKRKCIYCVSPLSVRASIVLNAELPSGDEILKLNLCVRADNESLQLHLSDKQVTLIANIAQPLLDGASKLISHSRTVFDSKSYKRKMKKLNCRRWCDEVKNMLSVGLLRATVSVQWIMPKLTLNLVSSNGCCLTCHFDEIGLTIDLQETCNKINFTLGELNWNVFQKGQLMDTFKEIIFTSADKLYSSINIINTKSELIDATADESIETAESFKPFLTLHITKTLSEHAQRLSTGLPTIHSHDLNIYEIYVKVNPFDCVLWFPVLTTCFHIIEPFLYVKFNCPIQNDTKMTMELQERKSQLFNTNNLPRIHVDTKTIRVFVPKDLFFKKMDQMADKPHDVLVLQIQKLSIVSQVTNPLSRIILHPDIFALAQQSGSVVEDRQYQMDIMGFSIFTGSKFDSERSELVCLPLYCDFDVRVLAAPAIVYKHLKEDIIVVGHSFEVNFITDVNIYLSVKQISLMYEIYQQNIANMLQIFSNPLNQETSKNSSFQQRTSDVQYFHIAPAEITVEQQLVPLEMLVTGRGFTLILYSDTLKQHESAIDYQDLNKTSCEVSAAIVPVMYLRLSQLHVFLQWPHAESKLDVSCFDVIVKGSRNYNSGTEIQNLPELEHFTVNWLETKPGDVDVRTGISPAFYTASISKVSTALFDIKVVLGRPWRISCSLLACQQTVDYIHAVMDVTIKSTDPLSDLTRQVVKASRYFASFIEHIDYETVQVVIVLETIPNEQNAHVIVAGDAASGNICLKKGNNFGVEEISIGICVDNLSTKLAYNNKFRSLLNSCCANVTCHLVWDLWNKSSRFPRMSFNVGSKALMLYFGADSWSCLKILFTHIQEFFKNNSIEKFKFLATRKSEKSKFQSESNDKSSQDDFRNGRFQCIEDLSDLGLQPGPNEIVFSSQLVGQTASITWRYPEPRVLTRAQIYPIIFQVSKNVSVQHDSNEINCVLQYWDVLTQTYTMCRQFQLTENQHCNLNMPRISPVDTKQERFISYQWRIIINYSDSNTESQRLVIRKNFISPFTLAAHTRIDSYFSSNLIPKLEACVAIEVIQINLTNHLQNYKESKETAIILSPFTFDDSMPPDQDFLTTTIQNSILTMHSWNKWHKFEYKSTISSEILEYRALTMRTFIKPFSLQTQLIYMPQQKPSVTDVTIRGDCAFVYLGQSAVHTLLFAHHIFNQSNVCMEQPLLTHYVICNNTQETIHFGQVGTNENVILHSRKMHAYCWRTHKSKQLLRVCIEGMELESCEEFSIDKVGVEAKVLEQNELKVTLIIKVKMISNFQKQITVNGRLRFANRMDRNLIIKLESIFNQSETTGLKSETVLALNKQSSAASCLYDPCMRKSFKIRLSEDENWSQDIYFPRDIVSDPTLVKIPITKDEYLTLLCHFFVESCETSQILVLFVPLYIIQTHLPCQVNLKITTAEKDGIQTLQIDGWGQEFQLDCAGTEDDIHQLTFNLGSDAGTTQSTLPLSLSLNTITQVNKLPHGKKIDIEEMATSWMSHHSLLWPYNDKDFKIKLRKLPPGIAEILKSERNNAFKHKLRKLFPNIELEISMVQRWPNCNTVLIHVKPWSLIINKSTIDLLIIIDGMVWNIENEEVFACPKIKDFLKLGLVYNDETHYSEPHRMTADDWSIRQYWPNSINCLPLRGCVRCDIKIKKGNELLLCCFTLTTHVQEGIRVFQVQPAYNVVNNTQELLKVAAFTMPETDQKFNYQPQVALSNQLKSKSDLGSNSLQPLLFWEAFQPEITFRGTTEEYCKYISFSSSDDSTNIDNWSLPCRLNTSNPYARHCFSIPVANKNASLYCEVPLITKPFLLTFHEVNKVSYLVINHDGSPQLLIHNQCPISLYLGQSIQYSSNDFQVIEETELVNCLPIVSAMSACHYTLPEVSKRFPQIYDQDSMPKLCLANACFDKEFEGECLIWSRGVDITFEGDLFLNIPNYGDVKVHLERVAHTMYVIVDPVSRVEISPKEIRRHSESTEAQTIGPNTRDDSLVVAPVGSSVKSTSCQKHQKNYFLYANIYWQQMCFILLSDSLQSEKVSEVLRITAGNCIVVHRPKVDVFPSSKRIRSRIKYETHIHMGQIQVDNQIFKQGRFDYPVVLIPQDQWTEMLEKKMPFELLLQKIKDNAFCAIKFTCEIDPISEALCFEHIQLSAKPIALHLEDSLFLRLYNILSDFLIDPAISHKYKNLAPNTDKLPYYVATMNDIYRFPIQCESLIIEPLQVQVSIHSSIKLDISLVEVPLSYTKFERHRLLTTLDKAVLALSIHYITGSLFKAGWVVGSLDVFGNPGGFARAVGSGFADFVQMPYRGLFSGPRDFFSGIADGTSSLFRQISTGYLVSVTSLANSVSRNMGRISVNEDNHSQNEEYHRHRPDNLTEGLSQGLSGFGLSLLAAISGIVDQPMQSVQRAADQSTHTAAITTIVSGVGKGLVGIIARPIAGAAELLAQTSQGILNGTGWSKTLIRRFEAKPDFVQSSSNSRVKYDWKMLSSLPDTSTICMVEASLINEYNNNMQCVLLLTSKIFLVMDMEKDTQHLAFRLVDVDCQGTSADPTLLHLIPLQRHIGTLSDNERLLASTSRTTCLKFHVMPEFRNIFVALFKTAKQTVLEKGFLL